MTVTDGTVTVPTIDYDLDRFVALFMRIAPDIGHGGITAEEVSGFVQGAVAELKLAGPGDARELGWRGMKVVLHPDGIVKCYIDPGIWA